jgi:tRNA G18 (ribose-2'-O)-methylase SpoU
MNTYINSYNVLDHLKNLSEYEIQEYYKKNSIPSAVAGTHWSGDFNLGTLIRSANFFGYKEVFYVGGRKHYDRRSTVGTHHYTPIRFIQEEHEFIELVEGRYFLICVENNTLFNSVSLFDDKVFENINLPPLFLFGEEQKGISDYLLGMSDRIITIPAFGSVRSLNVGSCASVVMAMYRQYLMKN